MAGSERLITFSQAVREALVQGMRRRPEIFVMGLGATDPKGIFGTTLGLEDIFGPERVFDMPISENAMTGIAVGASISGLRPVMVHQRADFVLMAMDQIVNSAAKWRYMYGGQKGVPLTIRTIIGRGWGQGPQHSQNFQALFAHIPGLKVVAPASPFDAKGLLAACMEGDDPVIYVEHRWLSNQLGHVPEDYYTVPIGKASIMRAGTDITIVASMDTAIEAIHVARKLRDAHGIDAEVINLRSIKPLDEGLILESVAKTGRLLVIDSGWRMFGVSAEIAAIVTEKGFGSLKTGIRRLGLPDAPTPTSQALSRHYYTSEARICGVVAEMLEVEVDFEALEARDCVSDVPDEYFKGPF